jgi:flagellar M-ring protein FliF
MEKLAGLKRVAAGLGLAKLGMMAMAAVAVLLLLGWIASRSGEPSGLLYSGLDPSEAGRIAQRLDELKIRYEARGDGTVILVPQSQVARTRMTLAASGLPHQGGAGYELLDTQSPMSMTSFMQRVQRLRALEGELARTIVTLNGVRTARVHIVLPERETFSREAPKATASVAVVMMGATRLMVAQASAIRLLVAGAVSGLQQEDVSVLDPSGIVLAADSNEALIGSRIAELKASSEQAMQRAVAGLLEPLVGRGKVRVVASIDIDASHEVSREEKYDPLSQVERSRQTQVDQDSSDDTKPRDPVSVGQNLPNQQNPQSTTPEKSTTSSAHNGQTVNYEIGSTKSERVREPGEIKRVTVSVVVDGLPTEHGDFQPRPKEELDRIGELVRSAVGFDAKRGDTVVVDTMHFVPAEAVGTDADAAEIVAAPPWTWLAVGGLVLLLVGGGGAFAMTRRKPTELGLAGRGDGEAMLSGPEPAAVGAAIGTPVGERVGLAGLAPLPSPLAGLYELIDSRPEESLAVIRAWIADGEAA